MRLVSPSFCTLLTLLALTGCAKDSSDDGGEDTSSQVVSDQDGDGFTVEDGDCNDEGDYGEYDGGEYDDGDEDKHFDDEYEHEHERVGGADGRRRARR